MEIESNTICFLDLEASVAGNKLITTVLIKPTDSHSYLHYHGKIARSEE